MPKESNDFPMKFRLDEEAERLAQKRVCLCIPTRGNDIYCRLLIYVLQQFQIFEEPGVILLRCGWIAPSEHMFDRVWDGEWEFAHLIDSDIAPNPDTTMRLLSHDVDVVTAPVWMFDAENCDIHLNVHETPDADARSRFIKKVGLQEIYSTSFSCLMVKRSALKLFKDAGESFTEWSPIVHEELKGYPTDVIFFQKLHALGGRVHVDWDIEPPTHHRTIALNGDTIEKFFVNRCAEMDHFNIGIKGMTGALAHGAYEGES